MAPLDGRPTILIADNDRLLALLIGRHLYTLGCEILVAADGADALVLAGRRTALYCAILSYRLPRLDGHTVARGLRALFPELPLVFTQEGRSARPATLSDELAASPVLVKPFTISALRWALAAALGSEGWLAASFVGQDPSIWEPPGPNADGNA
jgi:DNA-binding response OmpR family regulator